MQPELIAEGKYLAKSSTGAAYAPLNVRIYRPVQSTPDSDFRGMWTCQCEFSGVVDYSQSFPGVDSLQALEYAQVMAAAYFGHLCTQFEVRRPSESGEPKPIPLLAKSFLAGLLQGQKFELPMAQ